MSSYRTALQAVKAVHAAELPCTVAVDGEQREVVPEGVDILLRPTGDADFEPVSNAAAAILEGSVSLREARGLTDGGNRVTFSAVNGGACRWTPVLTTRRW